MIDRDELQWTAFRYTAGEMPADEAAAFEARLAGEQPAREALAAAVELSQAVDLAYLTAECVVDSPPAASVSAKQLPAPNGWTRPLVWMGAGAALCLAAVMVILATPWDDDPNSARVAPAENEGDGRALASAWLDAEGMRSELASLTAFSPDLFPGDALNGDEEPGDALADESLGDESLAEGDEFVLPAWMLAAVLADDMPDGDPVQEN